MWIPLLGPYFLEKEPGQPWRAVSDPITVVVGKTGLGWRIVIRHTSADPLRKAVHASSCTSGINPVLEPIPANTEFPAPARATRGLSRCGQSGDRSARNCRHFIHYIEPLHTQVL